MVSIMDNPLLPKMLAKILLKAIVTIQTFVRKNPAPFIAKIYGDGKISLWKDSKTLKEEMENLL